MNICMIEAAKSNDGGSIGAYYIVDRLRQEGHTVDFIVSDTPRYHYDIELISVHHPADYPRLKLIPKHGKIRIIGGHVTYNNPRPIIPLSDIICLGDGEKWIVTAVKLLKKFNKIESLSKLHGTIISSMWSKKNKLPACNFIDPLPCNHAYLNRPDTLSSAWYIEISRGCPFNCKYCELGHSMPYRYKKTQDIINQMNKLNTLKSRKIVFFAPDEASHPGYSKLLKHAEKLQLRQSFGSYRLDMVLKKENIPFSPNQLVRVGIDGLTQETRERVNKPITDKQILEYFIFMIGNGHVNFKLFQMIGHSWENPNADFKKWERLMNIVFSIPLRKSVSLRIKWTPLIPQPITPLAHDQAKYNAETAQLIMAWHKKVREPKIQPGWHVEIDGLMSAKSHKYQIQLTQGDETLLLKNATWINPKWKEK
jgi:radical SAM superfamily enzyme YgiQ (UPF0313 family)